MKACGLMVLLVGPLAGAGMTDTWDVRIATVEPKVGSINPGADFVVDATGTFHGCFASTEASEDTVTYLRWTPGGLQERTKLSVKPRRTHTPKIALAPTGEPVVLFVDGDGVQLARKTQGSWSQESLSTYGHFEFADLSLAMDASGHAHVLFNGTNHIDSVYLRYMHEDEEGWITDDFVPAEPLYGNHGQYHDLALDPNGNPHIIYQESSGDSPYFPVKYVHRNTEGRFTTEVVSDYNNVMDMEMALGADGVIHVVHPYANSYLSYCRRGLDGVWTEEQIQDPATGMRIQFEHADIALENGVPTIGCKWSSKLTLITRAAGTWRFSEIRYPIGSFGPRLGPDHQERLCCIYALGSGIGLILPPVSHLPHVAISPADGGGTMLGIEGLTPDTTYDLMRSTDLANWTRIEEVSSTSGSHEFEEPIPETPAFYRVELRPPPQD
ncbi:MAG: hypothetical protein KDN05_01875 [Verrucomicrobiae bacterium]|nr:hypothetical protein [Verrucomicrobiae bacterium]